MPRLSDNLDELAVYVQRVAEALGIPPAHVEKDFWLTQAMRACVQVATPAGAEVILKGGTSLSKAHGLIRRFSEDVDIVLVFPSTTSARARQRVMRQIATSASQALLCDPVVDQSKSETGVKRPVTLPYPSSSEHASAGLRTAGVLLELGTRGGTFPTSPFAMRPLIAEHATDIGFPTDYDEFEPVSICVLDPVRTLIEKLLILHDAATRGEELRIRETARHYYDVHQLLGDDATRESIQRHGVAILVDDVAVRSSLADLPVIAPPEGGFAQSPAFDTDAAVIARDEYDTVVVQQLLWPQSDPPSFSDCCERIRSSGSLLS